MAREQIPIHKVFMPPVREVLEKLRPVLESGWVGEGPKVRDLEIQMGGRFNTQFVNAVNTGTMGLELIAQMIGLGPGDEVISTPMTCTATNIPFARTGVKILWADVDSTTGNIDPYSVAQLLSEKTKAVVGVHWGGYPFDIGLIRNMIQDTDLPQYVYIVEDAAHANGARYLGKPVGTCNYGLNAHSDFAMFSLQAIKHITSIDGGLVTSYRAEDYERLRVLRWYGIDRKYRKSSISGHADWDIAEFGQKGHMNDVAATIALAQLPYLEEILEARRRNAGIYDQGLKEASGIKNLPYPYRLDADKQSSYWLYTIQVERREDFIRAMKGRGIDTSVVHVRNDVYSAFRRFNDDRHLENLEDYNLHQVSIPVGQWVSEEDAYYIVDSIRQGW